MKTLALMLAIAAGLSLQAPVYAHCGSCGVSGPHDHAEAAKEQCPPDCAKECCAAKDDAHV